MVGHQTIRRVRLLCCCLQTRNPFFSPDTEVTRRGPPAMGAADDDVFGDLVPAGCEECMWCCRTDCPEGCAASSAAAAAAARALCWVLFASCAAA